MDYKLKNSVTYLFTSPRRKLLEAVNRGENHDGGFWGMLRIRRHGVDTALVEIEDVFPASVCKFLRRHISVYIIHLPVFWKLFRTDFIYTSTAFGTQLAFSLLGVLGLAKPRWVIHDFSLTAMMRKGTPLRKRIFRWLVARATGIVTVSRDEEAKLRAMFPSKKNRIIFIPIGVDIRRFQPQKTKKERLVFSPGTDRDRDFKTLFSACADLDARAIVTTFDDRLEKFEHLPSFVEPRRLSEAELIETYARASVVAIPLDISNTTNEAMGCSVVHEAFAMGCAVVASRTPTMETYIKDGENGLLVPQGDPQAMKRAIAKILEDDDLRNRLSKNARAFAVENLEADQCAKKLSEFFKSLS